MLLVGAAVVGVVIIARKRAAAAPSAQSTWLSSVRGFVDGLTFSGTAQPPGVSPSTDPTQGTTPHGTMATELEGANGDWAAGQGIGPPGAYADYAQAAIAGVGPYSLYAQAPVTASA